MSGTLPPRRSPKFADGVTSDTTEESGKNFGRSEYQDAGMTRRGADDSDSSVSPCNIDNSSPARLMELDKLELDKLELASAPESLADTGDTARVRALAGI